MNTNGGFGYDDWTTTLQRFVDERGSVDYEGLAADREIFDRFVTALETTGPDLLAPLLRHDEDADRRTADEPEEARGSADSPAIQRSAGPCCAKLCVVQLPSPSATPFTPASLSEQLDVAMAEFVGEARNCTVDEGVKTVKLSKIFD